MRAVTTSTPRAIGRHIALVGFMGAGKTTIGREVARLTERPFVDTDDVIAQRHGPIPQLFEERGEAEFRRLEERVVVEMLGDEKPAVIALGGGAVGSEKVRARLRGRAFTASIDVDESTAWARVRGSDRPLARSREDFERLYREREPLYQRVADTYASAADEILLFALNVVIVPGRLASPLALGRRPLALVADERVAGMHPLDIQGVASRHTVPAGERAKTLGVAEALWGELAIGRDGLVAAFGGGSTTDLAGFVAATFLRGVPWIALPTTLVGQVDAAIGGKTGVDVVGAKNAVGAFHFPNSTLIDPHVLSTLPAEERRQGMAEVVKTGLLAGRSLWDLPEEEMIRACAAFKCAVVLSDPYEEGRRAILNLGHTFGHAIEGASDYTARHGDAVALGLLAALRLSGQPTDVVEDLLDPQPVRVDRERAWAALKRDKKAADGRTRLVLLPEPGRPAYGVELPDDEVRAELDRLIRD